jgi:hypothetical protein
MRVLSLRLATQMPSSLRLLLLSTLALFLALTS